MLKFMFYFWGIFAILWEMYGVMSPAKLNTYYKKFSEIKGDEPRLINNSLT